MYRIMVVDDEPMIREALKLLIKNNFSNLELCSEARNGFEAIDNFKAYKPDIIIMDIKMPGLNGLDAMREILKESSHTKFLVLSSYGEFEYARHALKLGAEDFLVKPAKRHAMIESLNSIINKLDNEKDKRNMTTVLQDRVNSVKPLVENDAVYSIISGCSNGELYKLLDFLEMDFESAYCMTVAVSSSERLLLDRTKVILSELGIDCIGAMVNGLMVLFIPYSGDEQEQYAAEVANYLNNSLNTYIKNKRTSGVGRQYKEASGFRQSYLEAMEALRSAEVQGMSYMHVSRVETSMNHEINIVDWSKSFFDNICAGEQDYIFSLIDAFFNNLSTLYGDNLVEAKDKVYQTMVLLDKNSKEMFGPLLKDYQSTAILQEISGLADIKGLRFWMISRIQKLMSYISDSRNNHNVNALVVTAVDYIKRKYAESLTLEDVAESLNISPFYLSRILKKHTGRNYTDLVAEMRISKAKEFLRDVNLSIKEVTYMTGFNSQNYFSRIFKKLVGISPSEYRRQFVVVNDEEV